MTRPVRPRAVVAPLALLAIGLAAAAPRPPEAPGARPAAEAPKAPAARRATPASRPASTPASAPAGAGGGRAAALGANGADPFAARSWLPPPPPPPPPAAPPPPPPPPPPAPPPSAPALPFGLVGLMQTDAGVPTVLLSHGEELVVAKAGDEILNRRYRVVSVTPRAIHFLYLPLQQAQVLTVPGGAP